MKSISDYLLTQFFMWKDFDAKKRLKIEREITNKKKNKKAIIFFPYWTGKSSLYRGLAKKFPDHTLIFYDYPNEVLSEDVKVSLGYLKGIIDDALEVIKDLKEQDYKEITLVGSSIGGNIALRLSTIIEVDKVVLNMMDKKFANSIFKCSPLKPLKIKLLKQGFTLKKIDQIYSFISTNYLVPKIKNKKYIKFLIFLSEKDIFCTYEQFRPELVELDIEKIKYELIINKHLGHILGIYKNIWFSDEIENFIKK